MDQHNPEFLYRYRSLGGELGRSNAEEIILYNRMFWTSPTEFNDPFDCDPIYYFGDSHAERSNYAERVMEATMKDAPQDEKAQRVTNLLLPGNPISERARVEFRRSMGETGVVCFSSENANLLMWAHYANYHTGVCIQFRNNINDSWTPFKVRYEQQRRRINLTKLRDLESLEAAVFLKSAEWEYEREYRIMDYRGRPGTRNFPPENLSGVILGARICKEDRAYMQSILKKRSDILVYKSVLHQSEFRVDIVEAQ